MVRMVTPTLALTSKNLTKKPESESESSFSPFSSNSLLDSTKFLRFLFLFFVELNFFFGDLKSRSSSLEFSSFRISSSKFEFCEFSSSSIWSSFSSSSSPEDKTLTAFSKILTDFSSKIVETLQISPKSRDFSKTELNDETDFCKKSKIVENLPHFSSFNFKSIVDKSSIMAKFFKFSIFERKSFNEI
uniref:Uncharacterized protein n=1 Tax=Romanomermis culicivorax TaxID=13658 RepID=A0A915K7M9_ROMCU